MKSTKEILGLSLICIEEGIEYGKLKDFIIDANGRKVEYVVVDDGQWFMGVKVLPYEKILGLDGDVAITQTVAAIRPLPEVQRALELAKKGVRVLDARVYTEKGKYIGIIDEYVVREEDGVITECRLTGEKGRAIPEHSIIAIGKGIMVITEDKGAVQSPRVSRERAASQTKGAAGTPAVQLQSEKGRMHTDIDHEEREKEEDSSHDTAEENEVAALLELRQKQFLLGRRSSRQLVDENGEVLVDTGEVITDEIIKKVRDSGRLVELTMNTRIS